MIALIMAGGFGTRFWPESRSTKPKQFLHVVGSKSMIQLTTERLLPLCPIQRIYVVTAAGQEALVKEHLPQLPDQNIILEPFGMNTAPCIALSVAYLKRLYGPDEEMLVLPADHVIRDTEAFHASIGLASLAAADGSLVTFGIRPDYPATGYGYIQAGESLSDGILKVDRFKEKPDLPTSKEFLATGKFYWNSGMFFWRLAAINRAFELHLPPVARLCKEISGLWQSGSDDISALYAQMPKIPIDIGIMEASREVKMIPVSLGWSDVGSWKALAEISTTDAAGNSLPGGGIALDAHDNYVYNSKFTALIGVDNLCVIETPDALLIVPKDRAEDVKKIVDELKITDRKDLL